jgi:hypothetical protein
MGMFKKKVRVSNSKKPEMFFEEEFWIGAGALYSFVPEDNLQKIGVEPSATRNLVLADGKQQAGFLVSAISKLRVWRATFRVRLYSLRRGHCCCLGLRHLKISAWKSIPLTRDSSRFSR